MKLINYRCKKCNKQQEELFTLEELPAPKTINCPNCESKMEQFNFTNNNTIQKFDWNKE